MTVWVLAGPIGMAFDACPMMSALCEGPCGILTATVASAPVRVAGPELIATLAPMLAARPSTNAPPVLDPPPRRVSLSA